MNVYLTLKKDKTMMSNLLNNNKQKRIQNINIRNKIEMKKIMNNSITTLK